MARKARSKPAATAAPEQAEAAASVAEAEAAAGAQGPVAGGAGEEGSGVAAAAARPDPEPEARPLVVEVKGPRKGRWRAGMFSAAEPVVIPLEDLTEEARLALVSDPALTVVTREAD